MNGLAKPLVKPQFTRLSYTDQDKKQISYRREGRRVQIRKGTKIS